MEVCRVFTAIAMAASVAFVGGAMAQAQAPAPGEQRPPGAGQETPTQAEEKKVEGQVRSVDPSGTEITLTDGTKLTTTPRTASSPGSSRRVRSWWRATGRRTGRKFSPDSR